ncbi:F-box protein At5g07610-like [Cucurbita pepo subsp. pepo]|uniref:F-box protein At5g07610-like n=1 Tax=Cucurbita pepo subsp. pepo TaxID=3664 RepID=UPI000C9D52D5|nr:F-box protein At5g07610-like [Cucurbita pepo subsp. pepo]
MLRPDALRIKTHFSSSAAAAAGSLANNDDLLVEILVRLPIPSVLRFKSVSKRWLSLISDPNFSHRRITFYPPTPSGIFLTRHFWRPVPRGFGFVVLRPNPPQVPFESLEPSVPKRRIEILQSCNGLLLCCSYGRRYGKNTYYVYNPMTKQYTTLPMLQMSKKKKLTVGPSLAYDPIRSSNYKVVCVRRLDSENFQIKIYSHDSGSWRSWCKGCVPIFIQP